MPGSGSPGAGARSCAERIAPAKATAATMPKSASPHIYSLATMTPRMNSWPAPHSREHSKV